MKTLMPIFLVWVSCLLAILYPATRGLPRRRKIRLYLISFSSLCLIYGFLVVEMSDLLVAVSFPIFQLLDSTLLITIPTLYFRLRRRGLPLWKAWAQGSVSYLICAQMMMIFGAATLSMRLLTIVLGYVGWPVFRLFPKLLQGQLAYTWILLVGPWPVVVIIPTLVLFLLERREQGKRPSAAVRTRS